MPAKKITGMDWASPPVPTGKAAIRWLPRSSVVAQAKALCACSGCARHAQRTQSVLGGIPTQSVGNDQLGAAFVCVSGRKSPTCGSGPCPRKITGMEWASPPVPTGKAAMSASALLPSTQGTARSPVDSGREQVLVAPPTSTRNAVPVGVQRTATGQKASIT